MKTLLLQLLPVVKRSRLPAVRFRDRSRRRFIGCLLVAALLPVGARSAEHEGLVALSLEPRSRGNEMTLFTALPPEETGIRNENAYDDPRMWNQRYRELVFGALGTGVAVGDYDSDGRPDIFLVSKTGLSRLYRNLGNWKFEDVTEAAGLSGDPSGWKAKVGSWFGRDEGSSADPSEWKQGAAFADVNNDGLLDLYICRFAAPNLLYMNQGDGRFLEEGVKRGVALVDAFGMAAFCDYDRDGWLDLYLQTNMLDFSASPKGQPDTLLRNLGDGTFSDVTAEAGIEGLTAGHSATWWDYDQDGWPDLYVANDYATPDSLYRNDGDGTFTNVINEAVLQTPYYSMGADLGDVNNDGRIDLLVADMAATNHEKDQRSMAGSRSRGQVEPEDEGTVAQVMRNVLYLNTDAGVALEVARMAGLAATDWTWSPRFEDYDNDGRIDLFVTNGMIREFHGGDLLDRIMVSEDPAAPVRIMKESPVLNEANIAFRNLGDIQFEEVSKAWGLDLNGISFGSATGDFDGDGDLDLVHANLDAPATILRNDEDRRHRVIIALRGTKSNRFGVGAFVRIETDSGEQVRQLTVARGNLSSSEPVLHFGTGRDDRLHTLSVHWPSGEVQTFADLPVDRRFVITEPLSAPTTPDRSNRSEGDPGQFVEVANEIGFTATSREREVDELARQPLLPVRQNPAGPGIAIGDVNGDGWEDILVGGSNEVAPLAFVRSPEGRFHPSSGGADAWSQVLNDGPLLIADFDGDGEPDILRTKAGVALPAGSNDYAPGLSLSAGGRPGEIQDLTLSVGAAAAADFNRDGRLDLFLGARVEPGAYPHAPASALLLNGEDGFVNVTGSFAPSLEQVGMVTSALWSDVDGDGWLDLLLTVEWGGVVFLRNLEGRGFEDASEAFGFSAAGLGWWSSLASADFNGDGRMDYVVGNLGLNTQYKASAREPTLLYLVKVGARPGFRMVEAYFENGVIVPRRTRSEMAREFRWVGRQFPLNSDYAAADLETIIGSDRLAGAARLEANQLQSGFFLSRSDGGYRFAALPRLAQIGPIHGLVAGDFDGDGHADVVALHNSRAPAPVVGRFYGGLGLLLRGDGNGAFAPVSEGKSGIVVKGDARALAVIDLDRDGWPDFLATRNRETALAFRNEGVSGRRSFSVSLEGRSGNPTAIGARVSVVLNDGTVQTAEVLAGSGYFSQSSPSLFFGFPEKNPPRSVVVRWPWGDESEHAFPPDGTELKLSPEER